MLPRILAKVDTGSRLTRFDARRERNAAVIDSEALGCARLHIVLEYCNGSAKRDARNNEYCNGSAKRDARNNEDSTLDCSWLIAAATNQLRSDTQIATATHQHQSWQPQAASVQLLPQLQVYLQNAIHDSIEPMHIVRQVAMQDWARDKS